MASTIVIPSTDASNTLYSGIADVFDTYTQNVKRKRKEEEAARKRAAKSTRAKGRGGLRSVKQRLDDESRLAEAEYDASDQKFNDWLTTTKGLRQRDVSQSFPLGPITMDKDEAFPPSYENIITPAGRSEKLRSEYDISTRTSKYNLQKLTEAGQWLQINEKRIYNARIEGDDAKLAKENIKYKKLQNIIKDLEYKIAFNTRKEVEDKIISDAESAESLATKRNIDANIAKQERDWRGGFEATVPAPQMVDAMVVPQQDWPKYKRFDPVLRPERAKEHIGIGLPQGFINEKEKEEYLKHYGLADTVTGQIGWPELDKKIKASGYSRVQLGEELAKHMKNVAGSSDDFTVDEQAVSSEAVLEALLQLQNINPQKDWLSEYRQIKSDKTNFIRETGSRSLSTLGFRDINWDPLTSEEIALTMLLRESKKRNDPQYESDKKRFKEKFGWLPKWA